MVTLTKKQCYLEILLKKVFGMDTFFWYGYFFDIIHAQTNCY